MMVMPRHRIAVIFSTVVLLLQFHGGTFQKSYTIKPWNNQLLLVKHGSIIKANLEGNNQELILENPSILGILNGFDYSYVRNSLYWGDFKTGQIWRLRYGESEPEPALPNQRRWFPCRLKVDDFGNKMYVVDCWSDSINIFDMKTGDRAVVLSKNFTEIKAFEMDSSAGYLFIVDRYQILRTDLDGRNTVVLLKQLVNSNQNNAKLWNEGASNLPTFIQFFLKNLNESDSKDSVRHQHIRISDIALDSKSKRVYYINKIERRIESFDYNGSNKRIHFQDVKKGDLTESESSLSFLDGWLYWLDKTNKMLYKINSNDKKQSKVILKNTDSEIVNAVGCSKEHLLSKNPCDKTNGLCQQLCVFSRKTEKNYVCACKIGYELDRDGITCYPSKEFILYSQSEFLRGHSLNLSLQSFTDIINPSGFLIGRAAGLQFNAADDIIYYSSLYPDNKLHRINLKTGEVDVLQPDLLSSKVGLSLAFDWESRNLYYFTYYYKDVTTLSVTNVDDPTYSKILVHNVPRLVRSIAVHPYRGYVYYVQMSPDADWTTIYRLMTDGSGLKVLIHKKGFVNNLVIDYQEDRIYWCDQEKMWYADLDGKNIKEFELPLKNVGYLAVFKSYIYTISKHDQVLSRLEKNNLSSVSTISYADAPGSFSNIEIYSASIQKYRLGHPCNQHRCQKFCFPIPDSRGGVKATCGCSYGEKLAEDRRTCEDNQKEEPRFVPCRSSSYLCDKKTE